MGDGYQDNAIKAVHNIARKVKETHQVADNVIVLFYSLL